MQDYIEHLRRCVARLNEHAEILREEAQVRTKEADALEREARYLFVLAVVETLKHWLRRL